MNTVLEDVRSLKEQTLLEYLFERGFFSETPVCAGQGKCGMCRVKINQPDYEFFADEFQVLGHEAILQGWRLACRHNVQNGIQISIPASKDQNALNAVFSGNYLGVDVGTTTIKWCDEHGNIFEAPNPQCGAGGDVISRMGYEISHPGSLQGRINKFLDNLVVSASGSVDRACLVANSAMIYILLGENLEGLTRSPYSLSYQGGSEQILYRGTPFYFPALISPFVGSDISAGLTWLLKAENIEYPFLFADLGTNGELILALSESQFLSTSVALGPALEGSGLRFGSRPRDGVGVSFVLNPSGASLCDTKGLKIDALKMSASAYIALLAVLRRMGMIDSHGRWSDLDMVGQGFFRQMSFESEYTRLWVNENIYIENFDIEEVLKVKAAFSFGFKELCRQAQLDPMQIARIYLAGALGEHVDPGDLEALGFFPNGLGSRVSSVGNAALKGSILLAQEPGMRIRCTEISSLCGPVDLAGKSDFGKSFVDQMNFLF